MDIEESQRIIRSHFKRLYFPNLEKLNEMGDFLDRYLLKVTQPKKAQGQMVSVQNSTRLSVAEFSPN